MDEVVRRGKRSRQPHLDLFWAAAPDGPPRLGLIVPKYRHTAVDRNRLRRRLRELWRRELAHRGPPRLVVFRARRESYQATFAGLRDDLLAWCRATGW